MESIRGIRWTAAAVLLAGCSASSVEPAAEPPLAEVAPHSASEQDAAIEAFCDKTRSPEARLEAMRLVGSIDQKTRAAFLTIGRDRKEEDAIRWEALRRIPVRDAGFLEASYAILRSAEDGGAELDVQLARKISSQLMPRLKEQRLRQEMTDVFRGLLRDPRPEVRRVAFQALVADGDTLAIDLTLQGLRDPVRALVTKADALELLYTAGPVNHIAAIRPFLDDPDPNTRAVAVRALGADPGSRSAIRAALVDPETPEIVRNAALDSLSREDPEYASLVIPIIKDMAEPWTLRKEAVRRFAGRVNYGSVSDDDLRGFADALVIFAKDEQRIENTSEVETKLLPDLRKRFPVIDKHLGR